MPRRPSALARLNSERQKANRIKFRLPTGEEVDYAPPQTDEDVRDWLDIFFGIKLSPNSCSPSHTAPLKAVADAYFARYPMTVWLASRGLGGKCVQYSEYILLPSGEIVTYGSLVGKTVDVFAPSDGGLRTTPATFTDNGSEPIWEVVLESGARLGRTAHHQIHSAHKHLDSRGYAKVTQPGFRLVSDIHAGDVVLVPNLLPTAETSTHVTDAEASFMGLMIADGSMGNGLFQIAKYPGVVRDEFICNVQGMGGQTAQNNKANTGVKILSSAAERLVEDAGLWGKGSFEKFLPSWTFSLPRPRLALMLNHLFATDGWISARQDPKSRYWETSIEYTSISQRLVEDISRAFHILGIPGYIREKTIKSYTKDGEHISLKAKDGGAYKSWRWSPFSFAYTRFFEVLGPVLGKEDICRTVLDVEASRAYKELWRHTAPEGYHWQKVVSVTELPPAPTVCISVPDGHQFCSPVVEHNSTALAGLSVLELLLGANVAILGGSSHQSRRVHHVESEAWRHTMKVDGVETEGPFRHLLAGDPTIYSTKMLKGNNLVALTASQGSARGPHPQRLRLDECMVSSTQILTPSGYRSLGEIRSGDVILSFDGLGLSTAVVSAAKQTGVKQTICIDLSNGRTIQCTPNHPLLALDQHWKPANSLTPFDLLIGASFPNIAVGSVEVLSVRRSTIEPVYDLTIPLYHNFIAEGVIVHNCDEMDRAIFDAAMGQTMASGGIQAQTVISSTRQYPDGTMQQVLDMAKEKGWPIYEFCVSGDSKIATPKGYIPIRDIHPGDYVYATSQGIGQVASARVSDCWKVGMQPTLKVTVGDRVLECTPDHRIMTFTGWTLAKYLQPGDFVITLLPYAKLRSSDFPLPFLTYDYVTRVEPGLVREVWDLTVPIYENFIAEGIVVHNCYRCNLISNGGWLEPSEVERKKNEVTAEMWCLPPDQPVTLADGTPKPIGQIQPGDVVLSGKGTPRKVTKVWRRQADPSETLLTIRTYGLEQFPLRLTANHEVYTTNGLKRADELTLSDVLISPVPSFSDSLDPSSEGSSEGSYEDGWLLGLYLAQGSSSGFSPKNKLNPRGHLYFRIPGQADSYLLGRIQSWHDRHPVVFPRKASLSKDLFVRFFVEPTSLYKEASVFHNSSLLAFLNSWVGLSSPSYAKRLSHLPTQREFARGILAGWSFMETLGSLDNPNLTSETSTWQGVTRSEFIAWQMYSIAASLGHVPSMTFSENSYGEPSWSLGASSRTLLRHTPLGRTLLRRTEASDLLSPVTTRGSLDFPDSLTQTAGISDSAIYYGQVEPPSPVVYRPIVSIYHEQCQKELLDLTVEIDHSYLSNGLAISNSTEYELQEPSSGTRLFSADVMNHAFDGRLATIMSDQNGRRIEFDPPTVGAHYATGADWAKEKDYCVDDQTEMMTKRGWLTYDQVRPGEDYGLAIDPETGRSGWQLIESVYAKHRQREMIRMEGRDHSSVTTPDHRWLVEKKGVKGYTGDYRWATTESLKLHDRIPLCAPVSDLPTVPIYSDAFVETVAWFWTEGHIRASKRVGNTSTGSIVQSARRNPEKVARIRSALLAEYGCPGGMNGRSNYSRSIGRRVLARTQEAAGTRWGTAVQVGREFGIHPGTVLSWMRYGQKSAPLWSERPEIADGSIHFCLSTEIMEILGRVAPDKVVTPDFLMALTQDQLRLFIEVSLSGDGTTDVRRNSRRFYQSDERRVRAFEMACALVGVATSTSKQNRPARSWGKGRKREGYEIWSVSLRNHRNFLPANASRNKTGAFKIERFDYDGVVWCPALKHHNWLARRNGSVYYTGNTVICTIRYDIQPARVVAYERLNKESWPLMTRRLDERIRRYPPTSWHRVGHDALGVGSVISDYLEERAVGFHAVGKARAELYADYIQAMERGKLVWPYILSAHNEHKYVTNGDLYGGSGHVPDTIAAAAIAWGGVLNKLDPKVPKGRMLEVRSLG